MENCLICDDKIDKDRSDSPPSKYFCHRCNSLYAPKRKLKI